MRRQARYEQDDRTDHSQGDQSAFGKTEDLIEAVILEMVGGDRGNEQGDYEGNVWFGDDGQGGATIRYNPKSKEFSYYPTPQIADQPKIEISRDGAVWYCPRSGAEPGVGVLYPDVLKITTLGAYYIDIDPITSRRALRNRPVREASR